MDTRGVTPEEAAAALRAGGIVDAALTRCEALAGGTASRVAALSRPGGEPELVIKVNEPESVRQEAEFFRAYAESALLPALRHEDPSHRFLVTDFAPGVKLRYQEDDVDVSDVMQTLVRELLGRYVPAGPARVEDEDWCETLGSRVAERREFLAPHVAAGDQLVVERLARSERRREDAPLYLLHGDCGAHNFLFEAERHAPGRLRAVIDPWPMAGYPIYDLAFAFVSWPHRLELEDILPAAEALRASGRWRPRGDLQQTLWEEIVIALYNRLGTCKYHHPHDLPRYLEAWPRWLRLV
jgi:Ser/Thr protein kinase RdoA (MazF antagonist)